MANIQNIAAPRISLAEGLGRAQTDQTRISTNYLERKTATTTTASATARATTDATAATDITATDVATCSVCSQNIVDGEEDALFCEGTCKQWVHRYCAGVPLIQFQSLSASPSPFLCSFCRQSNYDNEILCVENSS